MLQDLHLNILAVLQLCLLASGAPGGCQSRCSGRGRDIAFQPSPIHGSRQELSPFHSHAAGMHEEHPESSVITVLPTINDSGDSNIEESAPPVVIHEWPEYMNAVNLRNERTYRQPVYTQPFQYRMWMHREDNDLVETNPNRFRRTNFRMNNIARLGQVVLHYNVHDRRTLAMWFEIDPVRLQMEYMRFMGHFLRKVTFLGTIWIQTPPKGPNEAGPSEPVETLMQSTDVHPRQTRDEIILNSAWSWSMDYSQDRSPQIQRRLFWIKHRPGLQIAMSEVPILYEIVGYWTEVDLIEGGHPSEASSSRTSPPAGGDRRRHGGLPSYDGSGKGKGKIP